jgi:ABC-type branched-subunit amino acid transport system substrate-binding protein
MHKAIFLTIFVLFINPMDCWQSEPVLPPNTSPLKIGFISRFATSPEDPTIVESAQAEINAAEMAIQDINSNGGVLGMDVSLIRKDTYGDKKTAVEAAHMLDDKELVPVIIGGWASTNTIAVAEEVTIPEKILQISPFSTAPVISDLKDDDFVFRTIASDAVLGTVIGQLMIDVGFETASIMYTHSAYGIGLKNKVKATLEESGGRILQEVPHEENIQTTLVPGSEDSEAFWTEQLETAMKDDPHVILWVGYSKETNEMLPFSVKHGLADNFMFVDPSLLQLLLQTHHAKDCPDPSDAVSVTSKGRWLEALEGTFGVSPGGGTTTQSKAMTIQYHDRYTEESPYMFNVYDAVVLAALASEKAGSTTDSQLIRDSLKDVATPPGKIVGPGEEGIGKALEFIKQGIDIDYAGAAGPQDFDEHGDVIAANEIWKIVGGVVCTDQITGQ